MFSFMELLSAVFIYKGYDNVSSPFTLVIIYIISNW